jgi:hypothetical protein
VAAEVAVVLRHSGISNADNGVVQRQRGKNHGGIGHAGVERLTPTRPNDALARPVARGESVLRLDPVHAGAGRCGRHCSLHVVGQAMEFKNVGVQVGKARKVGDGVERVAAADCAIAQREAPNASRSLGVALGIAGGRCALAHGADELRRDLGVRGARRHSDYAGEEPGSGGPAVRANSDERAVADVGQQGAASEAAGRGTGGRGLENRNCGRRVLVKELRTRRKR